MKATLEFNLSEESDEHRIAVFAMEWALTCRDMDQELRRLLKYGNEFKDADEALEYIRKFLHDTLEERLISMDWIT